MQLNAATKRPGVCVTSVWLDMSRCPLPLDVEARRVGPFIKKGLKKLGFSGPITITAFGILSQIPHDVLRDLASTGIHLCHVPTPYVRAILGRLYGWLWSNPPPANVMVISLHGLFGYFLESISSDYTILGPMHSYDPQEFPTIFTKSVECFLWESLLSSMRADAMDSNPGALEECSGTGESTFYCSACQLDLLGFEIFTSHLQTKEHALEELEFYHPEGVVAARECRSRSDDAAAIQLLLNRFRETARTAIQIVLNRFSPESEEVKNKMKSSTWHMLLG